MPIPNQRLRSWQQRAFAAWHQAKRRGIVSVVTGGGKTVFAMECLREFRSNVPAATGLIVVPTLALLDQWLDEMTAFFEISLKDIVVLTARRKIRQGRINIGILNTISEIAKSPPAEPVFLIVDECHKAGSTTFRNIFHIPTEASLGLSATPERPYDSAFEDILVPNLGPLLLSYTYKEALEDGVIVPFILTNIVFDFDADEQQRYDRTTKAIQVAIRRYGAESHEAIALMLKRARISNISLSRVRIALSIVARHPTRRILIFHEDVEACEMINNVLQKNGVASGVYHSRIALSERVRALGEYRSGRIKVLVTCRALDEGFNVPETEIGIIAASTATHRQRVQRLGRILRPAPGKKRAEIYSIVASIPEIRRLAEEAADLDGIAEVKWNRA